MQEPPLAAVPTGLEYTRANEPIAETVINSGKRPQPTSEKASCVGLSTQQLTSVSLLAGRGIMFVKYIRRRVMRLDAGHSEKVIMSDCDSLDMGSSPIVWPSLGV